MATTIPDAKSEQILALWTGATVYVSLHTADPGKTGASEATGIGRVEILTGDWAAAVADATTGGRLQDNSSLIDFGTTSVEETYTHFGFWTADPGGTWLGGASLTNPVGPVLIGEGVRFAVGNLDMVGFGN